MKITDAKFVSSSTRVAGKPSRRLPEFAFIGRSNVGKSSLINAICSSGKLAQTSSTPGKTKLINHFLINDSWYLVDLPGYGYAKLGREGREEIATIISDYILGSEDLALLFVLVDSRFDIPQIDRDFIADLGAHGVPFVIVLTKCDKRGSNAIAAQVESDRNILSQEWEELPQIFCTSSQTLKGRDEILSLIDKTLETILKQ